MSAENDFVINSSSLNYVNIKINSAKLNELLSEYDVLKEYMNDGFGFSCEDFYSDEPKDISYLPDCLGRFFIDMSYKKGIHSIYDLQKKIIDNQKEIIDTAAYVYWESKKTDRIASEGRYNMPDEYIRKDMGLDECTVITEEIKNNFNLSMDGCSSSIIGVYELNADTDVETHKRERIFSGNKPHINWIDEVSELSVKKAKEVLNFNLANKGNITTSIVIKTSESVDEELIRQAVDCLFIKEKLVKHRRTIDNLHWYDTTIIPNGMVFTVSNVKQTINPEVIFAFLFRMFGKVYVKCKIVNNGENRDSVTSNIYLFDPEENMFFWIYENFKKNRDSDLDTPYYLWKEKLNKTAADKGIKYNWNGNTPDPEFKEFSEMCCDMFYCYNSPNSMESRYTMYNGSPVYYNNSACAVLNTDYSVLTADYINELLNISEGLGYAGLNSLILKNRNDIYGNNENNFAFDYFDYSNYWNFDISFYYFDTTPGNFSIRKRVKDLPDTNNPDYIELKDKIFICTQCNSEQKIYDFITKNGGIFKDKFVVKLDYLIVGSTYGGFETTKLENAKKQIAKGRDVKIISEKDFLDKINNKKYITAKQAEENAKIAAEDFFNRVNSEVSSNKIGYGLLAVMMAMVNKADFDDMAIKLKLEKALISNEMQSILNTNFADFLKAFDDTSTSKLRECMVFFKNNADKAIILNYREKICNCFIQMIDEFELLFDSVENYISDMEVM